MTHGSSSKALSLVVLVAATATACASGERTDRLEADVIDGTSSSVPTFALLSDGMKICSGVVLDPHTVLTAQHCVVGSASVTITVGGTDYLARSVRSTGVSHHEGELALLSIEEALRISATPLILDAFPTSSDARFVDVGRIGDGTPPFRSGAFACALATTGKSCTTKPQVAEPGDSGGPLFVADASGRIAIAGKGRPTLVGVTWGGKGQTSFHVITRSVLAELASTPERTLDRSCSSVCSSVSPTRCTDGASTTSCAAFVAKLPSCGFGCTFVASSTPRSWRCRVSDELVVSCTYADACGSRHHGARCERDGNGACRGAGQPSVDCDHCCAP